MKKYNWTCVVNQSPSGVNETVSVIDVDGFSVIQDLDGSRNTEGDAAQRGNLVAAAPDLEAVVERLVNALMLNGLAYKYRATIDEANAALAKARGL